MAKHDNRGRSNSSPYLQLHRWFLDCDAWRSLSVYARCLYIEIKRRYNGKNNGAISMSYREAEELVGCSNKPIPMAFRDLIERGFIKQERRGSFKGTPFATTWVLTELPQDEPVRSLIPSKEFMSWKPKPETPKKKTPHAKSVHAARLERTANGTTARLERAVSTPRAYSEPPFSTIPCTPRAGTINIPYTGSESGLEPIPTPSLIRTLQRNGWSKPGREQPIKRQVSEPGDSNAQNSILHERPR
ncbi:hypothetical protein ABE527_10825 [Brucella sp. TWI432]